VRIFNWTGRNIDKRQKKKIKKKRLSQKGQPFLLYSQI